MERERLPEVIVPLPLVSLFIAGPIHASMAVLSPSFEGALYQCNKKLFSKEEINGSVFL